MLNRFNLLIDQIGSFSIHSNVYGFCRSLIALPLLITFLVNPTYVLFPNSLVQDNQIIIGLARYSLFHLLQDQLVLAKGISILVLVMVLVGWRPRWTGVLHWWIAASFFISCPVVDGGDQIGAILAFLFIPFSLSDSRRWHWSLSHSKSGYLTNSINYLAYLTIRIQAAVVYFFAASEKLEVTEWKNGTVLYYWLNHSTFGVNQYFRFIVDPILESSFIAIITWSVLLLEVFLSMAILANEQTRIVLLKLGLMFHLAILFLHGLFTFFFYMAALLLLYLWPIDLPLSTGRIKFFGLPKLS